MTGEQIRAELREIDKACLALLATGGYKHRKRVASSDEELERFAAAVPGALKILTYRMLAGMALAERLGKVAELESTVRELMMVAHPGASPPQLAGLDRAPPVLARGTCEGYDHGR